METGVLIIKILFEKIIFIPGSAFTYKFVLFFCVVRNIHAKVA